MFFQPSFRPRRRYARRGIRPRGNSIVLLLIFFMIGLFLHYGGETQPVVAFWNDLRGLVGLGPAQRNEARPRPEPSDEAERSGSASAESGASAAGSEMAERAPTGKLFPFEKQVDFILPAFTQNDQVIRHDGYTLRYQEAYEQADWVAYPLLENEVFGDAERDNMSFKPDPLVRTRTALPTDYTRTGYDRGHLAPAGDFKFSERLMEESFFMSNISPQAPDFNRGIWKELEEQVRAWAVRDKGLYVVTGPVLKPGLPEIGKKNKVAVPEQYYKVILYCRNPEIRMIGFLLTNEGSDRSLKNFVVPVDEIERLTGIDFFPKLPDSYENRLESAPAKKVVSEWFTF